MGKAGQTPQRAKITGKTGKTGKQAGRHVLRF